MMLILLHQVQMQVSQLLNKLIIKLIKIMKIMKKINVTEITNKDLKKINGGGDIVNAINWFFGYWSGNAYKTQSAIAGLHAARYE